MSTLSINTAARIFIFLEFLTDTLLFLWLHSLGLTFFIAIVMVISTSIFVRGVVLTSLCLKSQQESLLHGTPWPSMTGFELLKFSARSALFAAKAHWIEMPWGKAWNPLSEIQHALPCPGSLIILVPGYACSAKPLRIWQKAFESKGFAVCRFEYSNVLASIDHHAHELFEFTQEAIRLTGKKPFFVGHSMGGLISIKASLCGADIQGILTVASPLDGTFRSSQARGDAVQEMQIESDYLQQLKKEYTTQSHVPLHCIWTSTDPIVSPNQSARGVSWNAQSSMQFDHIGHLELLINPRCASQIAFRFSRIFNSLLYI